MITGDIKNKIDQVWNVFFVAGITSPIAVLEQMTYIFFMKLLDDKQLNEEALNAMKRISVLGYDILEHPSTAYHLLIQLNKV